MAADRDAQGARRVVSAARFTGRTALVTGGGSGIGRAMVQGFHHEGAHVVVVDIDGERAGRVVADLGGERLLALEADVSAAASVGALARQVFSAAGTVDILCNNAGIFDDFKTVLETDEELWDQVMAVDVKGPFLMSKAFLPPMIEQGRGAIVMTASIASSTGGAGGVAYTVAKHAILGLTRQLAFDHGRSGVRVNAVCPGAIATNLSATTRAEPGAANQRIAALIADSPAGRLGTPEEIANLTLFLASDEASYMHGSPVVIDGGWTIA